MKWDGNQWIKQEDISNVYTEAWRYLSPKQYRRKNKRLEAERYSEAKRKWTLDEVRNFLADHPEWREVAKGNLLSLTLEDEGDLWAGEMFLGLVRHSWYESKHWLPTDEEKEVHGEYQKIPTNVYWRAHYNPDSSSPLRRTVVSSQISRQELYEMEQRDAFNP